MPNEVQPPSQNHAPPSPPDRVLREFGEKDATRIVTGEERPGAVGANFEKTVAQLNERLARPTYYAKLLTTGRQIEVTKGE